MSDRREEILNAELGKFVVEKGVSSIYPKNFPEAYKSPAIFAMDEYMKEVCLELLEFIGKNNIECERWADGARFWYKNEWLTSEQLFENFL